ncbi:MAG: bifunctional ADP-heptose synthase [Fimbriimonadaceae bacterium]
MNTSRTNWSPRHLLESFVGMKAVVFGDLMLDEYLFCHATRISPEAPVMVVRHRRTTRLPGGAANVARNLAALGAEVSVVGLVGDDEAGDLLVGSLVDQGMRDPAVVREHGRATTRKTRVVADHSHQVLRIDAEEDSPATASSEAQMLAALRDRLVGARVLVLSDYLKGALSRDLCTAAIAAAREAGAVVVANPKPRSLSQYDGVDLVSLNRVEATEALGRHRLLSDEETPAGAAALRDRHRWKVALVTLGESGLVAVGDSPVQVEAPKVEVYDTAGAGDTVIATVALGYAAAGFVPAVFSLAAETAACVVRRVGVATPGPDDIERLKKA